jgi:hypothetical protein
MAARKRRVAWFIYLFVLVCFVAFWIHGYFRYDVAAIALGSERSFIVDSYFGRIQVEMTTGLPAQSGASAVDPEEYDAPVRMAQSVGLPMTLLRDRPSFSYWNHWYEHRDQRWHSVWVSFPCWLVAAILSFPLLLVLWRRHAQKKCAASPVSPPPADAKS